MPSSAFPGQRRALRLGPSSIKRLEDASTEEHKANTYSSNGISRCYQFVVVVVNQRLSIAVQLTDFYEDTFKLEEAQPVDMFLPDASSFSRFNSVDNVEVVISCS